MTPKKQDLIRVIASRANAIDLSVVYALFAEP